MAVPKYQTPVEVYAGDGWSQTFRFGTRDDSTGVFSPDDLSGWESWKSQWRRADQVIELTVDSAHADDGEITVHATGTQTRAMGGGGNADIQAIENVGDDPRTFVRFATTWLKDVTV